MSLMGKCPHCKKGVLKKLGVLLGGIQIWGCSLCHRCWWCDPTDTNDANEPK